MVLSPCQGRLGECHLSDAAPLVFGDPGPHPPVEDSLTLDDFSTRSSLVLASTSGGSTRPPLVALSPSFSLLHTCWI